MKQNEIDETHEAVNQVYGINPDAENAQWSEIQNDNNRALASAEEEEEEVQEQEPLQTTQLPLLRRYFILEPPIFLIYFASSLSSTVFQNQLLYQTCTSIFHYSDEECRPMLGISNATISSPQIEKEVQLYVSRIVMALSLVNSIIPAVLSLFIGPWSDKFGRRPILIVTMIGYILNYLVTAILALVALKTSSSPWLYIISATLSSVTGGICAMMIVTYCYITDVAPMQLKGLKMVLNDAALGAGSVLGSLAGGYLFAATNMATVSAISMVATILALLYVILVNEESLQVQEMPIWGKVREFFSFGHVVDMVRCCIAKRSEHKRLFIWLTMIALIITNFTSQGESNVFYLFLRKKFSITVEQYSNYNSIANGIQIVGGVLSIILLRKYLHFSIITMGILSLISCVLESIVRAAAQQFWEMYLGAVMGLVSGIVAPMLLTTLSFNTPAIETGKIFSITTSLQTITPLGAAPLYTTVYDATLEYYPGLFNIISAVLYFVCLMCIVTIFGISKRNGIVVSPAVRPRA